MVRQAHHERLNLKLSRLKLVAKKNSKGYKISWIGYKLHIDVADRGIPISAVLTSACFKFHIQKYSFDNSLSVDRFFNLQLES